MSISIEPKIIQDAGEVPLVLYSDVRAPLASLSFLRRSLAMAELAMIAYNDESEALRAAQAIGFSEAQLLDSDGSQAPPSGSRAGAWMALERAWPPELGVGPMCCPSWA